MSALSDFHGQLQAARAKLAEATEHQKRAADLLSESRQAIVAAHEQADPWLPPQLDGAIERLGIDAGSLHSAADLLDGYQARL
jgi:hypothetical protein